MRNTDSEEDRCAARCTLCHLASRCAQLDLVLKRLHVICFLLCRFSPAFGWRQHAGHNAALQLTAQQALSDRSKEARKAVFEQAVLTGSSRGSERAASQCSSCRTSRFIDAAKMTHDDP